MLPRPSKIWNQLPSVCFWRTQPVQEAFNDQPSGMMPLDHEAEAKIRRWHACGTASGPGVPDEIRHVGTMRALDDANTALGIRDLDAVPVQRRPHEAGVGPLPHVAGQIGQSVAVDAECAGRLWRDRTG